MLQTRGANPSGGELKVDGDPESGHLPAALDSFGVEWGSKSPIPNSLGYSPISKSLVKIVGHLWKKSPTRSFAAIARVELAPIVCVEMQPRGGGCRQAWAGFGGGRNDRGRGDSAPGTISGSTRRAALMKMKEMMIREKRRSQFKI